jgi:DUF971 family protein
MNPQFLKIVWEDGREQILSIHALRDNCPCAGCSGERIILHEYVPPEPNRDTPGRYELKGISPVGSYALQMSWGDGHATGIYTFELLYQQKS